LSLRRFSSPGGQLTLASNVRSRPGQDLPLRGEVKLPPLEPFGLPDIEPLGPPERLTGGKKPSARLPVFDPRGTRAGATRWYTRIIREEIMQLRSGVWPDYDPFALLVLVVGIITITTLAVCF
jgi:hypothetical protein